MTCVKYRLAKIEVGKSVGKLPPKFTSFRRCFRCLGLAAKAQHSGSRVSLFDTVVSHLYPLSIRKEYGRTCETAGKSGKQIERCVISTFRIAESIGFKGEFRQWEHLLALPLRSSLTADL